MSGPSPEGIMPVRTSKQAGPPQPASLENGKTGGVPDPPVSPLDADVATLLELLDACVAHHDGPEALALVASVRTQAARRNWTALAGPLAALEPAKMVSLVRACLAYFHAANIAEQVHRADELALRASTSRLAEVFHDLDQPGGAPGELTARLARMD